MPIIKAKQTISQGKAVLGIEFGSTRIKAVLIDENNQVLATGSYRWDNQFKDGVWTYDLEEVSQGLKKAYSDLALKVKERYDLPLINLAAIGISGMMHGYLAFDDKDNLLVPFRTWRNLMTAQAAEELSKAFSFTIPQRWSIAHLYQAILNKESHVGDVRFITTLAGYVHWQLTGEKAVGLGEASGMFPLDINGQWDEKRMAVFNRLAAEKGFKPDIKDVLPKCYASGQIAGRLTEQGRDLLDESGQLNPGIPLCPPEGDAATGMVATNAVGPRTGNVSAGTSIFAMVVLDKALKKQMHPEINIIATPDGLPVAMIHSANCTTDINNWVAFLADFQEQMGQKPDMDKLYQVFFESALHGEKDAGGVLTCGYYSGEHITGFETGLPFMARGIDSKLNLQNLSRSLIYSALATLAIGMEVLKEEAVSIDFIQAHGGLYKEGKAGQAFTAAALNTAVSVMETASEGGAWGIALLAAFMVYSKEGERLEAWLNERVFSDIKVSVMKPDPEDVRGFNEYLNRFKKGLLVEQAAITHLN
ncbi:MAG: FGGY-family carbohydrate kinase [Bacillota bacterium]|nr:FGGY-family carbohydrate kinase [Bacillota bacterium]